MKYVLRPEDVPSYSPANHSGTKNYRMVAPGVNGAKYMEIIYGDIERHEGAVAHMHPDLEQATYVIEGEAKVEVGGEKYHVKAGDLLFFPSEVYHDIQVITERIKLLVIYSPPYGEVPSKVVKKTQDRVL
ncbi:MAG: cupin domain-containing protein [Pseudolabrys sp.]|jgi:quercetin dioxygenase-like cupin family protein